MSDDSTSGSDERQALLEMPTGARKLTTIGMAQKTPGLCACGEHPDPDEPAEAHAEVGDEDEPLT